MGEPYSGPMWPTEDNRKFHEVLLPRLKAAAEQHDMVPVRDKQHFDPQPWAADDNKLPGALEPYFLKSDSGPRYLVGGSIIRPLATTAESNNRFYIGSIEGSSKHTQIFSQSKSIKFDKIHHAFQVVSGSVNLQIGNSEVSKLSAGEIAYIPAGSEFKFEYATRFAKAYVFSNGSGVLDALTKVGQSSQAIIPPEKEAAFDASELKKLGESHGFTLS